MTTRGLVSKMKRKQRLYRTLELKKKGYSLPRIAVELGVSAATVKSYLPEIPLIEKQNRLIEKQKMVDLLERKLGEQRQRNVVSCIPFILTLVTLLFLGKGLFATGITLALLTAGVFLGRVMYRFSQPKLTNNQILELERKLSKLKKEVRLN